MVFIEGAEGDHDEAGDFDEESGDDELEVLWVRQLCVMRRRARLAGAEARIRLSIVGNLLADCCIAWTMICVVMYSFGKQYHR